MPLYHFHSADGVRQNDESGTDLPNDEAARLVAVRFAGEMLNDHPRELWEHGQWRVEVTNDKNILLFTVITLAVGAPKPGAIGVG